MKRFFTKKKSLILFILLFPFMSFAQRSDFRSNKWHLDFAGGLTFKGYLAEIGVGLHDRYNINQWGRVAIEYLSTEIPGKDIENFNRDINFPVSAYSLSATYNRTVFSIPGQRQMVNMHGYVYLDIGIGGVVGYETINNSIYKLETGESILDRSKMIYGGVLRADLEIFFDVPNITVFIAGQQKYLVSSDLGKGRFSMNFGLRYWLNY